MPIQIVCLYILKTLQSCSLPFLLTFLLSYLEYCLTEITQLWSEDVDLHVFIHYHTTGHKSVCESVSDFSYQEAVIKKLQCYDGWTDIGIFVYFDTELTLEDCQECKPPDADDENVVAYYFEVRKINWLFIHVVDLQKMPKFSFFCVYSFLANQFVRAFHQQKHQDPHHSQQNHGSLLVILLQNL